jgi:DNA-directed RNA polymerase subunit RPC12/RpoP
MADTPEKLSKYRCPKCGSDKVAEGSGNKDNVCQECGKEWPHEPPEALTQCEAKLLGFKKPHVLLTVNQDLRRAAFESKLDAALGIINEDRK